MIKMRVNTKVKHRWRQTLSEGSIRGHVTLLLKFFGASSIL
jgi:hypothetical protein